MRSESASISIARRIGAVAVVLTVVAGCSLGTGGPVAGTAGCEGASVQGSIFLAGDSLIVKPWSDVNDPAFLNLVDEIRKADVAITNLETVIHEFKGFPQAHSGGTYMASPPEIASELVWAGFDMVGHANNHAFDYGSIGVLENLEHVEKAGLVLAGSGKDLQRARAPGYFRAANGTVALVASASTFTPYGLASASRPDLHGRPGVNPLRVKFRKKVPFTGPIDITFPARAWTKINPDDLEGNLAAVRAAQARADFVVFSIHAHGTGRWLPQLAHRVIDAGADVFFTHGPHEIRGMEIYRCKPIFYGLGDFVFQPEQIERLPSEEYEARGLKGDAPWEELQAWRAKRRTAEPYARAATHEGLGAVVRFGPRGVSEVRLIPVDLGFGQPMPIRGRPRIADPELGRKIIADATKRAKPFGATITYLESENVGVVTMR